MSARVFEFRPQQSGKARPAVDDDGRPGREQGVESALPYSLPPEVLYRIFCSDDGRLQDLAMEYFLLECD